MERHSQDVRDAIVQWLGETWATCLAQVIESMAGERPRVEWKREPDPAQALPPGGQALWWEQGFDLTPEPAVWAGMPEETWTEVATRALRALEIEEIRPEEARTTWLEILRQSFTAVAQALGARKNCTVTASQGRELESAPDETQFQTVQLTCAGAVLAPIWVAFREPLVEAMARLSPGRSHASWPDGAPQKNAGEAGGQAGESRASMTLDLLREVELPVSVSFGRARMTLQDVLKLTAGSVVELDRAIDDPVALIVNDMIVALGEVVVVEGNYGLRIQRILSREKLLRTSSLA